MAFRTSCQGSRPEGSSLREAGFAGAILLAAFLFDPAAGSAQAPPTVDFLRSYRASFHAPSRLAVDSAGRVYVADPAAGSVTVRAADGRVLSRGEGLGRPVSVAAAGDGDRIWVGDGAAGRVSAYGPGWQRQLDLGAGAGELGFPGDLALDPATDDVWVTDSVFHRVAVYDGAGAPRFAFGGRGDGDGRFQFPTGIFFDAVAGEVLVVDQQNGRVQIFDASGSFLSAFGVKGTGSGKLNVPQGIWVDDLGRIYVADAFEGWVHVLSRSGATMALIGGVAAVGVGPDRLRTPSDVVIDLSGRLFVSSASEARLGVYGLDGYSDPERFVPAEVAFDPSILDLASGAAVTAAVEVLGYRLSLVDAATLSANGVPALPGSVMIGDVDGDQVPDLSAAFDGPALAATLPPAGGTVRVAAQLGDLELEGLASLAVLTPPGDDADGDGVPNDADACPGTTAGAPTDDRGCSLEQLCPCAGPAPGQEWRNRGQYVACVARRVQDITRPPLDPPERKRLLLQAAWSSCARQGGRS